MTVCHGRENPEDGFDDAGARSGTDTAQMAIHMPPQSCSYDSELRWMVNVSISPVSLRKDIPFDWV